MKKKKKKYLIQGVRLWNFNWQFLFDSILFKKRSEKIDEKRRLVMWRGAVAGAERSGAETTAFHIE